MMKTNITKLLADAAKLQRNPPSTTKNTAEKGGCARCGGKNKNKKKTQQGAGGRTKKSSK